MIIEKQLSCNQQEFFDALVEAIINDIYASTDHKVDKVSLKKGYTYSKIIPNKKKAKAKATIKEYKEPQRYCLEIKSENGKTTMDYKIQRIDDKTINIIYKEEYKRNDGKKYNGIFYRYSVKKRMKSSLQRMEKYIQNKNH